MKVTEPLVLPEDVVLLPVEQLPEEQRGQLACDEGDVAMTRLRSRTSSRILDAQAARLLERFRSPTTIVQAVYAHSQESRSDAFEVLESAFPLFQKLLHERLLVPVDAQSRSAVEVSLPRGTNVAGHAVVQCIQVLEDTEVYEVRDEQGRPAALKVSRPGASGHVQRLFAREAAILGHLAGRGAPALRRAGAHEERPYLLMGWCDGVPVATAAAALRRGQGQPPPELLALCGSVLEAYARLHALGVIHGDVHPGNILIGRHQEPTLIDFGLARWEGGTCPEPGRGGVAYFFEPEYALARRAGHRPPPASFAGEQYALGALLYWLLTGKRHLDFSAERDALLRQLAEEPPLPFSRQGVEPWPEVEAVLSRALAKTPGRRFASVAAFAQALREVPARAQGGPAGHGSGASPALAALRESVLRRLDISGPLFSEGLRTAPSASVNYGAAGIAYALYRQACLEERPELLSFADAWCARARRDMRHHPRAFHNPELELTPEVIGSSSLYHTESGVHCVQALISQALGDLVSVQEALEAFVSASRRSTSALDLTLGRAGTLLGCALLAEALPAHSLLDTSPLRELGEEMHEALWARVEQEGPIHEARELTFLGMAHGWAGILFATLRWCLAAGRPWPSTLQARLDELATYAERRGRGLRWPRKLHEGRPRRGDSMAGWCNGSAGHVFLWTLAHEHLHEARYLELAEGSAWDAWEDATAYGSLCCGLSGRAYALLNLYKHTGGREWLVRATELGERAATDGTLQFLRDSLYKGEVGVALLAGCLDRPELSCMPLFEHEGW